MVDTQVNTEQHLFQDYIRKPVKEQNMNTEPVSFGSPKPEMVSCMIQTEMQVEEWGMIDEPGNMDPA